MPALVAGIHVFFAHPIEDVDGRDKPGHDGGEGQGLRKLVLRASEALPLLMASTMDRCSLTDLSGLGRIRSVIILAR